MQPLGHWHFLASTRLRSGAYPEFEGFLYGQGTRLIGRLPRSNQLDCGTLNRNLLIPKRLIFESRVRVGSPSLAAAPVGPPIPPWLSASAASIISFSCLSSAPSSAALGLAALGGSRLTPVSSTEKGSPSLRVRARSITFCSSRTLPGQPYAWNSWRVFRLMVLNFFPAFFPKRSIKYSTS